MYYTDMKFSPAGVLIVAILCVAIFGSLAMNHGEGCLASAARGGVMCPLENLGAVVAFYLDALRGFSAGVIGLWVGILVLLGMLWGFRLWQEANEKGKAKMAAVTDENDRERLPDSPRLLRWHVLATRRVPVSL